jgi:Zn ribbon nucleic-acid-binding protein
MANSTVSDRASVRGAACPSCGSVNQQKFSAEIGIHFPELKSIDKPVVWVFPEIVVCLGCGTAQFAIPETELRQLAKGDAAAG